MAKITGNIINPLTVKANIVIENEVRTELNINLNINYLANSLSPSLFTVNSAYFMDNFTQVKDLIFKNVPESLGNKALNTASINKLCLFKYEVNENGILKEKPIFDNIPMQYIDGGKTYLHYGSISEKKIYLGWEPVSNEDKYPHEERSDVYGFDYPQFTPRGTRKIPISGSNDTLCGPVTYDGNEYTYDRLNYNWIFGQRAGINFQTIETGATPVVITGSSVSQEGCSSISNQKGELLFYTDGNTVYTSGNTIMVEGLNLSSSGTSTQSSLIVPQPNSDNYYIFTTDYEGNPNGFEYSIVDMLKQNGDGQITLKNIKLIPFAITEKVTACSHSNEEDYWIITHTSGDSKFYSYRLRTSGLVSPVISNTGVTHTTSRGYMKTSPDSKKNISLLYDENIIQILDFNNTGGTLSNEIVISGDTHFINGPYGLEYSSDSSKFYVSDGASYKIIQYDLSYTSATDMMNNSIVVADLPKDSSLGALQMGPDEKIYAADYLKDFLHVIHRPNGLGVQCNFKEQSFSLTGISSGVTSTWGLPNVVTSKTLSCDRYVYVSDRDRTPFDFELVMNDVSDVITPNKLNFTAEVYPFNINAGAFSREPLYEEFYEYSRFSGESGTTLTIPLNRINEGEFLIKGYYDYPIKTLIQHQLGIRRNTVNTYKIGSEYNIYNPETDWYFLNIFKAEQPFFVNTDVVDTNQIANLTVSSRITTSGQTRFSYESLSDPIVTYNGIQLAKGLEYSSNTETAGVSYVEFYEPTLPNRLVTLAFVREGQPNNLKVDTYTVTSPIVSGETNQQTDDDKLYYNTTKETFEYYLPVRPQGDVGLSINGELLSHNIEYLQSSSDLRRMIILVEVKPKDIIQAFYSPVTGLFGPLQTNTPTLSWTITNRPIIGQSGVFTVEVTDEEDKSFENIKYISTTPYIIGENSYSVEMDFSEATAGTKLIYRVKNQKFYTPIVGEIITSIAYSDTIPIEIVSNKGNIY
jgi:hypothetical protein